MLGRWMRGAFLLALVCASGCSGSTFNCSDDTQCVDNSLQGQCESDGWCSFDDDTCGSGRRYGVQAGEGLAEMCVPADGSSGNPPGSTSQSPTSDTGTITSTGSTSSGSLSSGGGSTSDTRATTAGSTGDACPPETEDCDGDPSNGCESNLSSAATCGACDKSCLVGESALECADGVCTGTIVLEALEDARVSEDAPAENFSLAEVLLIDGAPEHETLIRVPVFDELPADAVVESAVLILQCVDPGSDVSVHGIVDPWAVDEVTWETRPGAAPQPVSEFDPATGPVEINVTAVANGWLAGPENLGLLLQTSGTNGSNYGSSEATDPLLRPRITLTLSY